LHAARRASEGFGRYRARAIFRLSVTNVLLPILVITVPVLAIALLAVGGRKLSGSCGGMNPDGSCQRCGKQAGAPEPEGACSK
jgi:hypothetical protein